LEKEPAEHGHEELQGVQLERQVGQQAMELHEALQNDEESQSKKSDVLGQPEVQGGQDVLLEQQRGVRDGHKKLKELQEEVPATEHDMEHRLEEVLLQDGKQEELQLL